MAATIHLTDHAAAWAKFQALCARGDYGFRQARGLVAHGGVIEVTDPSRPSLTTQTNYNPAEYNKDIPGKSDCRVSGGFYLEPADVEGVSTALDNFRAWMRHRNSEQGNHGFSGAWFS